MLKSRCEKINEYLKKLTNMKKNDSNIITDVISGIIHLMDYMKETIDIYDSLKNPNNDDAIIGEVIKRNYTKVKRMLFMLQNITKNESYSSIH